MLNRNIMGILGGTTAAGIFWMRWWRNHRRRTLTSRLRRMRIPANPTSDSDLKASTVPTQSIQYVRRLRRWGEYHFRSGWLRSNSNPFLVELRIS